MRVLLRCKLVLVHIDPFLLLMIAIVLVLSYNTLNVETILCCSYTKSSITVDCIAMISI
jgi:hypothetical protein